MTQTRHQAPRWRIAPADPAATTALSAALGLHPLVAQVLVNRGLRDPMAADAFLAPRLDRLQNPLRLSDMARAVGCIDAALRARRPVAVYGDYDADGVTATAILVRALRALGGNVEFYIPDRRREGYGLHPEAVAALAGRGIRLLVAVDCGTGAHAAAEAARAAGVDLVVLDHHEPPEVLPPAAALVNPKRTSPPPEDYCAAGLAFQAARALFGRAGRAVPDDLVPLAAIGTVADAVTLLGDNRVLVAAGLASLARPHRPGLAALVEVAGVRPPFAVRDISHGMAPRLNAAGRLAHASDAVRLLLTDDPEEARALAEGLDRLNAQRRQLCDAVLAEVLERVEREGLLDRPAVVLAQEGWHPGVIGIVASQLVERFHRPVVMIALEGERGRGSARSIPIVHLLEALREADRHLLGYGGHAMAAGLVIAAGATAAFARAFEQAVATRVTPEDLRPVVEADAEVDLSVLSPELVDALGRLAPHGPGNPEPVFLTRGLQAVGTTLVGDGAHLRLVVGDGRRTVEAIAFRHGEKAELLAFTRARVDLAYTLAMDPWVDPPAVQLVAVDMATPGVDLEAVTADAVQVLDRLFARASDYLDGERRPLEQAEAFHTKVVGVTYAGRQAAVQTVRPGERLRLVREPRNPSDPYAVQVRRLDGTPLGFLRARLAAHLAPAMDAGARYAATAVAVTGGGERAWGLNILVEREAPAWPEEEEGQAPSARWPAGADLTDFLAARLLRGRAPTAAQREILARLQGGERLVLPLGPGRGLVPTAVMAALAVWVSTRRPVVLAVPRAAVAEAWGELMIPWLRRLGVRAAVIHGAVSPGAAGRVAEALERGRLDLLIASLAWIDRNSDRAAPAVVVGDAVAADEVEHLLDRAGGAVRLLIGSIPPAVLGGHAARAFGVPAVRTGPRAALRVIDRRGRDADAWLTARRPDGRLEKTLVLVADPAASVSLATRLHEGSTGRHRVAYYHTGLPTTLRRVLEDLFGAGRLACLVLGTHATDPAIPPDARRVVALALRPDPLLAAEELGLAGLGGRAATVVLAYPPDHLAGAEAALDAVFPSRAALARCYRAIRAAGGSINAVPGHPPALQGAGCTAAELEAVLAVLTEAGVLAREDLGEGVRYTLAGLADRVDLTRSLRYAEGERARSALGALRAWASSPAAQILADLVGC
ncbi:MAG: single-stranded-DNA-specific exonuclease RecJ [Armatimonadota bacterium]|nr:single-stranded-DNA-specific exonuclease RecJ [Armatimonadota bacterium]